MHRPDQKAFVWQLTIWVLPAKTIVKGLLLKGRIRGNKNTSSVIKNLYRLVNSYRKTPLDNSAIQVVINGREYKTTTNRFGEFEISVETVLEKAPGLAFYFKETMMPVAQEYPFFFKNVRSSIDVISDIDDTILVSHTANFIKRIGLLSFVPPSGRKTVSFTLQLLQLLAENHSNVFYVSKSESNLFGILYAFININHLPKGILLLTPYLNFRQLLKGKKGKDFKLDNIRFIIENSEERKFVLFGDDTQKDMEIYAIIARQYPDKIVRIYIRQTKTAISKRKQTLIHNLKEIFPDTVYFNENSDIDFELELLKTLMSEKGKVN